jgi:hypothetical protein
MGQAYRKPCSRHIGDVAALARNGLISEGPLI